MLISLITELSLKFCPSAVPCDSVVLVNRREVIVSGVGGRVGEGGDDCGVCEYGLPRVDAVLGKNTRYSNVKALEISVLLLVPGIIIF